MASLADRKDPGVVGVFFGAALSVALGALLAGVHLASQPVEVVKDVPKEPKADALYFVQGASGKTAGKSWQVKRDSLAEGGAGEVAFTEAELNAWSEGTFETAKVDDAKKSGTVMILAGVPNFRIADSTLQVGLVNTVNFFGTEAPLVFQVKGGFEKAGSGWRFAASEASLGALPLHKVPALLPLIAARFGASALPAEVDKVLSSASGLAVKDGSLVVTLP
jgi:hypothetical protein